MKARPRMPAAPPRLGSDARVETLRELMLAFVREVDSIAESGPPEGKPGVDFNEEVRRFEVDLIRQALTRTGGDRRGAAHLLNLKVATLNAKIRRYGIRPDAFKTATGS